MRSPQKIILSRELVPLEVMYELAESIASVKGQLKGLEAFEDWILSIKNKCVPPEEVERWIQIYKKRVIDMKDTLVDSAKKMKKRISSSNEIGCDPVKAFEKALLIERVASRYVIQKEAAK